MKSRGGLVSGDEVRSHPSRGAWIEICGVVSVNGACPVAPLTGCVD